MPSSKPKKQKIEVDKEFLEMITKTVSDINKRLDKVEKPAVSPHLSTTGPPVIPASYEPPVPLTTQDYIFECLETSFFNHNPQDVNQSNLHKEKMVGFRNKLKSLMLEWKVGKVSASILKKL